MILEQTDKKINEKINIGSDTYILKNIVRAKPNRCTSVLTIFNNVNCLSVLKLV